MVKGVTGLGGAQTGRLAELVVGDDEIVLAPGALSPLAAVRATLMCLRTSASQEGAAEVMGVSRPTVSRTISVVTRVIARACLPATAEEIPPRGGLYVIDGILLACWRRKGRPRLRSGRHRRAGMNLRVLVSLTGHPVWASEPLPASAHDSTATPGPSRPPGCSRGSLPPAASPVRDASEPESPPLTKNLPTASQPRLRSRRTKPWAKSVTSSREPSRTSRPGRSWPTTADNHRAPSKKPSQPHRQFTRTPTPE